MGGVFLAPLTKLLELNFTGHQLLVLRRPIVNALTGPAGQFNESILRHTGDYTVFTLTPQP